MEQNPLIKEFREKFPPTEAEDDAKNYSEVLIADYSAAEQFLLEKVEEGITAEDKWFLENMEEIEKIIRWGHTRGSHSDDREDTEPCDCRNNEINGYHLAFDALRKRLEKRDCARHHKNEQV